MPFLEIDGKKIDIEKQLIDIDRSDCEDSLYKFLKGAWRYIDASPFTDGWPIEAVAEHGMIEAGTAVTVAESGPARIVVRARG